MKFVANYRRQISLLLILAMFVSLLPSGIVFASEERQLQSPVIEDNGKVTFCYQGDGNENMVLKGEFTDWNEVEMDQEEENDIWSKTLEVTTEPGIYAYGMHDKIADSWKGDPLNSTTKKSDNNPVIVRNPIVDMITGEVTIYYPYDGEETVELMYRKTGQEEWNNVEMSKDNGFNNMCSVTLEEEQGVYEYYFKVGETEYSDTNNLSSRVEENNMESNATFIVPAKSEIEPDELLAQPGGESVWRVTGNCDAFDNWDPTGDNGKMIHLVGEYYQKSVVLPSGKYEFKFTKNGNWDGSIANQEGNNFSFTLTEVTKVNFYINDELEGLERVRVNLDNLEEQGVKQYTPTLKEEQWPRLVGDIQTALGEEKDWSPSTACNYFVDYYFDNSVYKMQRDLPSGSYECKVVYGADWDCVNYGKGSSNYSITVVEPSSVTFTTKYCEDADKGSLSDDYKVGDSIYDGKLDSSNFYFDSRSTSYKSPFGAIKQGKQAVTFRFATAHNDAQYVKLELIDGSSVSTQYPMSVSTIIDGKDYWEVTVPAEDFYEIAVWGYKFIIVDGSTKLEYGDDASSGGTGSFSSEGQTAYNLTVYDPDYKTPDWLKNGIVYQIFPDRFCDGDTSNNQAKLVDGCRDGGVQLFDGDLWSTLPENPRQSEETNKSYYPDATTDGIWNNEFYGGDLEGIQEKIDYLKKLGVTVVYLNPVAWSSSNHKYDATDYQHLDPIFGEPVYNEEGNPESGLDYEKTREASDKVYQEFAAACRKAGIYLIADGVFNHVGDDSIYFDRFQKYPEIGAYEFWSKVWPKLEKKYGVEEATYEKINAVETMTEEEYQKVVDATVEEVKKEFLAQDEDADFRFIHWFNIEPNKIYDSSNEFVRYKYDCWWGYDSMPEIYEVDAAKTNLTNDENATIEGKHEYNNVDYRETVIGYDLTQMDGDKIAEAMQTANSQRWLWMGASGWRLDVAPDVSDDTWRQFRKAVKSAAGQSDVNGNEIADPVILGEEWGVATNYLLGDMFDSVMNYQFRNALQNYIMNGDAAKLNEALETIRENYPEEAWYAMLNLVDSHDTTRNITKIDYPNWEEENVANAPEASEEAIRLQTLTAIFQLSYPGAPTIYYGDEVGLVGTKDPDSRRTFPWERINGLEISEEYQEKYGDLFQAYVDAAKIRNNYSELFATGAIKTAYAKDDVIVYARKSDTLGGLSAINRSKKEVTIEADVSDFLPNSLVLEDQLGSEIKGTVEDGKIKLTIPASSGLMMVSSTKLTQLPAAPANVKATAVDGIKGKVQLSWDSVEGAESYNIYRMLLEGTKATLIGSVEETEYEDSDVVNGTRYYYYIQAKKNGQEGIASNVVSAIPSYKITTITKPTQVSDLVAGVGNRTDDIKVDVVVPGLTDQEQYSGKAIDQISVVLVYTDDETGEAQEVKLRYNEDTSVNEEQAKRYVGSFEPTKIGSYTYYAKATVNNGTTYVSSTEQKVNVLASEEDTTPPKEPVLEQSAQESNRVVLNWTAEDDEIEGFLVLRATGSGKEETIAKVAKETTTYNDYNVSNNTTYTYRIAAYDKAYNRSYSKEMVVTPKLSMVDVTVRLTIPNEVFTSATDTIYIASDQNGWSATGWEMKKPSGATDYNIVEYTFQMMAGKKMQYKFTRGSWETEALTSSTENDTKNIGNYAYSSTDTNISLTVQNQGNNKMLVENYVLRWVDMPMMITLPRKSYAKAENIVYETEEESFTLAANVPYGVRFTIDTTNDGEDNPVDINELYPRAMDEYGIVRVENIPLNVGENTFILHIQPTEETLNQSWYTDQARAEQATDTKTITITRKATAENDDEEESVVDKIVNEINEIVDEVISIIERIASFLFGLF